MHREAADQARSGFPQAAQSEADPRPPAAASASESTAPCPAPWQIVGCREISMKVCAMHRRMMQAKARTTTGAAAQNDALVERPSRACCSDLRRDPDTNLGESRIQIAYPWRIFKFCLRSRATNYHVVNAV